MSIAAADLITLGSLNRPEDDVSTVGGGIDIDHRPAFTQLAANDDIEVLSSSAGDTTQVVTVTGRNAAGEYVAATATLTGTTAAILSPATTFERVLKVSMGADAVGIVTVRRSVAGATIGTIPIGERGFYALFIKAASETGTVDKYEKIFWKNTHGTLTLTSASMMLTADPSAKITIGCATAIDDTGTATNRETAPGGVSFVDDSVAQAVPTGNIAAASAIGVWIKLSLGAANAALNSSFTTQLSGTST